MEKSKHQINIETMKPFGSRGPYMVGRVRVLRQNFGTQVPIGEEVNVNYWGTFGCWDTENRWISLYDVEVINS